MKVKSIFLRNSSGKSQETFSWLTIGKVYHVLEVIQGSNKKWMIRLVGDDLNGAALFPLEEFEIVTHKLPDSWIIKWDKEGFFRLTPEPWSHAGFWERFYDKDSDAMRVFEREKGKIINADP
jgi:hypothetical protein